MVWQKTKVIFTAMDDTTKIAYAKIAIPAIFLYMQKTFSNDYPFVADGAITAIHTDNGLEFLQDSSNESM